MDNIEVCVSCQAETQARMAFCLNCGARMLGYDLPVEDSALASIIETLRSVWLSLFQLESTRQVAENMLDEQNRKIAQNPRDGKNWLVKGNVLLSLGQFESADNCYDRALVFDPRLTHAWIGRAIIALIIMQYTQAVQFADVALTIDSNSVASLMYKSYGLLCLGKYDDAMEAANQALSAADHLLETVNDEKTRTSIMKVLRVGFALKLRAHLLISTSEYDDALKAFDQALALDPDDKGAANDRTSLLAFLGRHEESQQPSASSASTQSPATRDTPVQSAEPMAEAFSGNGQQVSAPFKLGSGLARFQLSHSGRRHFGVWLLDGAGNRVALLANRVGSFNGSMAVGIKRSGIYLLNIDADGSWVIRVQQP